MDEEDNTMMSNVNDAADTPTGDDMAADMNTSEEAPVTPDTEEEVPMASAEDEEEEDDEMPTMAAPSGE